MKSNYIRPMIVINAIISESFICQSKTDQASIGASGSQNERNQSDISTGGPGEAGSKKNLFEEQYSNSLWED
ncbi:hypothetical protein [Prevotella sp.]